MKNKRRRQRRRQLKISFIFIMLIFLITAVPSIRTGLKNRKNLPLIQKTISVMHNRSTKGFIANKNRENLHSAEAILINYENGQVLFDKNSAQKAYPASLTKIMTALVAIENTSNIHQTITLPANIFPALYQENASMAGFLPDEQIPVIDLLYGTLLPSGAECSIGLAVHIAGSEESFVKMMNAKAAELNMNNTHFTNSTGLHNPKHYTTAGDMSKLLQYALQNSTFREIFSSMRYSTSPSNKHPDGITFYSTLSKNLDQYALSNGEILGGKTGFTSQAGLCLASLAQVNNKEYILITLGANGDHQTEPLNLIDAINIYRQL